MDVLLVIGRNELLWGVALAFVVFLFLMPVIFGRKDK